MGRNSAPKPNPTMATLTVFPADIVEHLEERMRVRACPQTRLRLSRSPPMLGGRAGVRGFSDRLRLWDIRRNAIATAGQHLS